MTQITINATINAPMGKVWKAYTNPDDIIHWNSASEDWHTPWAENDLQKGGKFTSRMEAKDGSIGFEFSGTYDEVKNHELIEYIMEDGRKAKITFERHDDSVIVTITFDAEKINSVEMQREGWQSILNNFKKYVEAN